MPVIICYFFPTIGKKIIDTLGGHALARNEIRSKFPFLKLYVLFCRSIIKGGMFYFGGQE